MGQRSQEGAGGTPESRRGKRRKRRKPPRTTSEEKQNQAPPLLHKRKNAEGIGQGTTFRTAGQCSSPPDGDNLSLRQRQLDSTKERSKPSSNLTQPEEQSEPSICTTGERTNRPEPLQSQRERRDSDPTS